MTDSRVYNLVWLGRWIERAHTISRVLLWAAEQEEVGDASRSLEEVARMAASVRGVQILPSESALDALLTRDSGASVRGCLVAARYNATQVAPIEVIQIIGAALRNIDDLEESPSTAQQVTALMSLTLATLDELYQRIEDAWFHSAPLSEEDVYRRFVQQ